MNVALTRDQVRQVDRIAIEEFGLPGIVLMENAGRNATRRIREHLRTTDADNPSGLLANTIVFCGTGNNGGDGFVIARHLTNIGHGVRIVLAGSAERLADDAAVYYRTCQAMEIPVVSLDESDIRADDLVVDALLGTGFTGKVREPLAGLIDRINDADKRSVVAVDLPSGLDCDSGLPSNACIRADRTITFAARKFGFDRPGAAAYTGIVDVVDIGAPRTIIERLVDLGAAQRRE